MTDDIERIREALHFIPASDRDTWVKVGMGIKCELGDAGFDLWEEWSQQDEAFDPKAALAVWRSIRANGKVTAGTLFHEAKVRGWHNSGTHQKPTPEKLAERRRIAAERAAKDEVAFARERDKTAKKAAAIWKAATSASAAHPYLSRKHVSPVATLREIDAGAAAAILGYRPNSDGKQLLGRLLVVPVKQGDWLSTLELIDGKKRKTALAGRGTKSGGYWAAQPLPEGDGAGLVLTIGEGVATVLSVKEATGHLVIAALSAGNLATVAKAVRERYPAAALVILADLVKATGAPDPHATEAARSVGGLVAVPNFGSDRPEGASDFNDMAAQCGAEAVARAVAGVIESATCRPTPDAVSAAGGDSASPEGADTATAEQDAALSESKVSEVSGVQANNDGISSDTPVNPAEVSEVSSEASSPIPDVKNRPAFSVFDDWLEHGGAKFRPGVWYFGTDENGDPTQAWICSPLHVEAVTFDGQDNNFGRQLGFKNTLGRERKWAMPMEMLAGDGVIMRAELMAMGVEIDPSAKARYLLASYLQAKPPKRRMRCASQVGWCNGSFILPDTVIGPAASGVIFQSRERGHEEHTRGGTLAGWQSDIAARAVGNPILVLTLSASFAGPLLAPCNAESGGIHLVDDSATGKTTAVDAAVSVWGGRNFKRSWNATANGQEGAAAMFNDCLLVLDEISEADPREVGRIVYSLGNGTGKQRANRSGNARGVTRWCCSVLSSGERTVATTMAEGGHRIKAGQAVRLLDVPSARRFGAWDDLHGFRDGPAFSDAIKKAATMHHGHAGRAFLEKLTRDKRDFCALLERIKALPEFSADSAEGQDKRAAGRFALLALAGEVTTEYGITGWTEGEAIKAAAVGFKAWRSLRGHGNNERRQILERVSGFIERHGDGRFSDADATGEIQIRDRAGWWCGTDKDREYLFTADGMREALKGFDFNRALDALQEAGALPAPAADGKRAKFYRISGRGVKLYPVQADKLGGR